MKGRVIAVLLGVCGAFSAGTGWAQSQRVPDAAQGFPFSVRGVFGVDKEDERYRHAVSLSFAPAKLDPHWPVQGIASEAPSALIVLASRYRREGLPVLRLSAGRNYWLALGLNPHGVPGVWWTWKPASP